jgi:DNA-directed RNA polymerase specialized sigma24 family protein
MHPEAPEVPEDVAVTRAQSDLLTQSLLRLRSNDFILLNLRFSQGLSFAEVAELVGKSEAAVRKSFVVALNRLRDLMDNASAG